MHINIDKDNIHLTYGNIYKSLPQRLIDLDLTQQWETQGESIKKLFNRQKENISGNKYFMFTLSLRGYENSQMSNYIKEILEELLMVKTTIKPENIIFEANNKKMSVIKYNIISDNSKILAYKYKDTSPMITILIKYL